MSTNRLRWSAALAAVTALGIVGACADGGGASRIAAPHFETAPVIPQGYVILCKSAPSGEFTFDVINYKFGTLFGDVVSTDPDGLQRATVGVAAGSCRRIWESVSSVDPSSGMHVTERVPADWTLDKIVIEFGKPDGAGGVAVEEITTLTGTNDAYMEPIAGRARRVTFYNSPPPPPPPPPPPGGGSEGCTPGFWKQSQHFDSWVGYTPSQNYDAVFGVSFLGSTTLLQALNTMGNSVNRFIRNSTAALLSASNSEVDYGMTPAQVISTVQAAVASGDFTPAADEFGERNERSCPLN